MAAGADEAVLQRARACIGVDEGHGGRERRARAASPLLVVVVVIVARSLLVDRVEQGGLGDGGKLLEEGLCRVPREAQGGLAHGLRGALLAEFLALEVAVERVKEESVVRDREPVEDLLLLLCADAILLEQQLEELGLRHHTRWASQSRVRCDRGLVGGCTSD